MPQPRAFIVCVNTLKARDYESLSEFTALPHIHLTEGLVKVNGLLRHRLAEKLADFNEDDYLVLSGSLLICAQALAILIETFEFDTVKVLTYNQRSGTYAEELVDGYIPEFAPTEAA